MSAFKKLLSILLASVLLVSLCCCYYGDNTGLEDGLFKLADAKGFSSDKADRIEVDDNGDGDDGSENTPGKNIILNTSSKKIHLSPECTYAKSTKPENKLVDSADKLTQYVADGYNVCSNCNKNYAD